MNIHNMVELDQSHKRNFNQKDKAWYVPYRLVADQVDNFKTIIDPAGCVNVSTRTFGNIRMDTRHNQHETVGRIMELYNEIDPILGVTLNTVVRYGEDDFLTDEKGNRILTDNQGRELRSSAHAYELGVIKAVSIDFHPIETAITENGRPFYRKWNLNRVSALTTLQADVPGQAASGELAGANYRMLDKKTNNKVELINQQQQFMPNKRCLCDSKVGSYGRSNIDNSYIELLRITGEGENKEFTLKNVLTGDEFNTKYDDHYDQITSEEVTTRINELLESQSTTRLFDEKVVNELRACTACQAKMAQRNADLAKKVMETTPIKYKRFYPNQAVKQKATDKIGIVKTIFKEGTDTDSIVETATITIDGSDVEYKFNTDDGYETYEYEGLEVDDIIKLILPKTSTTTDNQPNIDTVPPSISATDTTATRALPIPATDTTNNQGTDPASSTKDEVMTIEILKSQLESLQSTVNSLVSDVEILKTPVTRVLTNDETEAKRIEETFERLFITKKNEAAPIHPTDEKTKQLNKANETISKFFGLNV